MKVVLAAASALIIFSGIAAANAQNAGPTYSDTIHQSAGERDSRGTPKYYQSERRHYSARRHYRHHTISRGEYMRSTTGAGPSDASGPYYDNSIHQSKGRDSRGTPKTINGQ